MSQDPNPLAGRMEIVGRALSANRSTTIPASPKNHKNGECPNFYKILDDYLEGRR
jgi:hypothetical protein